ncbi:MAG: PorT family protein, partial [Bacteroidota bacterium]
INLSWGIGGGVEYGLGESTALIGGIYFQNGFVDVTDDAAQKIPLTGEPVQKIREGPLKASPFVLGLCFKSQDGHR